MAENTSKLGEMNKVSLDSIRSILDANTIVGEPIATNSGTTIIPISKITVGYASGGMDYAKKNVDHNNFGGGGGTGASVVPVAFLVIKADGNVEMLNVGTPGGGKGEAAAPAPADSVSQVVGFLERSPELIEKIKSIFAKKKNEENDI